MKENDATFKCPSCGMEMIVEPKTEDIQEEKMTPSMHDAATMPLHQLRERLPKKED